MADPGEKQHQDQKNQLAPTRTVVRQVSALPEAGARGQLPVAGAVDSKGSGEQFPEKGKLLGESRSSLFAEASDLQASNRRTC